MQNKPQTISYFENFDALRFFSAVAVLLFHKFNNFNWEYYNEHPIIYKAFSFIARNGFIGVNFFFVLSGFLITYLIIKEIETKKHFNLPNFLLRRILRIWPVYFIVLVIGFILKGEWQGISYYLSFLSNVEVIYRNAQQTGIQFPLWSVSIEEQFYLAIPSIIFFVNINAKSKFLWLYSTLLIISTVYQSINYHDINKIYYATMSCITALSTGGILGALSFYSYKSVSFIKSLRKRYIIAIYLLGFFYIIVRVYLHHLPFIVITEHLLLSIFFGFILMEQTFSEQSIIKLKRFKLMGRLGTYTYGLYLYHMIVLVGVHYYWDYFNIYDNILIDTIGKLSVSLTLSLVICWLSFKYIESPFLNLKKKFQ
jgi:peptidoglycan/LPS O-acetylase OafA/YrhL